ncbi:hypothetical protein FJ980_01345 [Mesorhizobium sp. B1-1-5]|nr:hypothetical protein FJ980_01345 [Mesorhizobium sp. B1-1-5]
MPRPHHQPESRRSACHNLGFGRDLGRRQSAQRRSRNLVVSGANTYTGQTIVDSGPLRTGSARPSSARRPSRSMAARWTSTASTRR